MQLTKAFITFISIATLAVAAPLSGAHDVLNDINGVNKAISSLYDDVNQMGKPSFNMMSILSDNKAIIDGLDHITRDATIFTSAEAAEIIAVVGKLADKVELVSKRFIEMKDAFPIVLRGPIAQDLRTIVAHAQTTGNILVGDCPADKRAEASKVYGRIALSLDNAVKEFS